MNFKPWQIFFFSLVPLALVFAGVVGASFHGKDSAKEVFAAAPTAAPPGGGTPGASPPAGATLLEITARNTLFDKRSLSAPPNTAVAVRLNNQDAGILHNVAFFRSKSQLAQPLVSGARADLVTGIGTTQFSFTTPGPGTYYFHCDVHPDTMNGSFIVR